MTPYSCPLTRVSCELATYKHPRNEAGYVHVGQTSERNVSLLKHSQGESNILRKVNLTLPGPVATCDTVEPHSNGHLWAEVCGCNRQVAALQRCKHTQSYHLGLELGGCCHEMAAVTE